MIDFLLEAADLPFRTVRRLAALLLVLIAVHLPDVFTHGLIAYGERKAAEITKNITPLLVKVATPPSTTTATPQHR